MGYLKIPQAHVKTFLEVSGQWGLFFNQLDKEPPVTWIKPSAKDLDPRDYLKEALVKANDSKTCLAFRTGGGSSLGLRGVAPRGIVLVAGAFSRFPSIGVLTPLSSFLKNRAGKTLIRCSLQSTSLEGGPCLPPRFNSTSSFTQWAMLT